MEEIEKKKKKNKHTAEELRQWQKLPLETKLEMTKQRIRDWVDYFGENKIFI